MALSTVIPSKHVSEIHQLVVDFSPLLVSGETILPLTVAVTIGVYSGTDNNPNVVLVPSPSIIGSVVSQGLQKGVVGVIYFLDVTTHTTLGNIYHIESKLAVLQDDYPAGGAFVTYYFTSQMYPYSYGAETLHITASVQGAFVLSDYHYGETLHIGASVQSAQVFPVLKTYQYNTETLHTAASAQSAIVTTVLRTYQHNTETLHIASAVVSATVTTVLIVYQYNTETLHIGASVQSAIVT